LKFSSLFLSISTWSIHLLTKLLLAQNFQKIPKPIRELAFNLIVFDLGKSQLLKIFEEVIKVKKEKFDDIILLNHRACA